MACTFISNGRPLDCKDSVGGLKAVYFVQFDEVTGVGFVKGGADTVTSITTSGGTAYKYELKGNSNLEQTINSSRENGTTFYEQVLNLTLPKISQTTSVAIKLLTAANPQVIVEDYNKNLYLIGFKNGTDVTGGTIVTGSAMGDMSVYTLTLTGMEQDPALLVSPTTQTETEWTFSGGDTLTIDLN